MAFLFLTERDLARLDVSANDRVDGLVFREVARERRRPLNRKRCRGCRIGRARVPEEQPQPVALDAHAAHDELHTWLVDRDHDRLDLRVLADVERVACVGVADDVRQTLWIGPSNIGLLLPAVELVIRPVEGCDDNQAVTLVRRLPQEAALCICERVQPLLENDGLAFPAGPRNPLSGRPPPRGSRWPMPSPARKRSVGVQTCLRNEQRPCPACHRPLLVTDVVWPLTRRTELHVDLRGQHADGRHRRQTRNSGTESARCPVNCRP